MQWYISFLRTLKKRLLCTLWQWYDQSWPNDYIFEIIFGDITTILMLHAKFDGIILLREIRKRTIILEYVTFEFNSNSVENFWEKILHKQTREI